MDWGTIGAAIGGSVAAAIAVPLVRRRFTRPEDPEDVRGEPASERSSEYWQRFIRETMIEVINGRLGQTLQTQTRLLEKLTDTSQQMASSLAVLAALEQRRHA
jgi:hypothetical protein